MIEGAPLCQPCDDPLRDDEFKARRNRMIDSLGKKLEA